MRYRCATPAHDGPTVTGLAEFVKPNRDRVQCFWHLDKSNNIVLHFTKGTRNLNIADPRAGA